MEIDEQTLSELDAEQLRQVSQRLLLALRHQRALNEKLTYECALLKRLKFAAKSERHSLDQRSLLEEELDSDLAAVEREIEGNPPEKPSAGEVEISRREFLHEEVQVFRQPDHGGAQARGGWPAGA
jgi:hypothetical protein